MDIEFKVPCLKYVRQCANQATDADARLGKSIGKLEWVSEEQKKMNRLQNTIKFDTSWRHSIKIPVPTDIQRNQEY